ncbi:MAG: UvrD-helicase domain-containing protein [bacterium]|nr:UvrD-helicase domain-containing protein [Candidatus Sumerlaeota bacterium]
MTESSRHFDPRDILADLNPQQYEAVTAPDGPLLIIAGAGSGKTRVITRRIAYLVRERGVQPYQIFAATFTNKAADEMKRRVARMLGAWLPHDFHIATFHSLCARILRRQASAACLPSDFTICDEADQLRAVKHVMKELGITDKSVAPADAHNIIMQCKIRMLGPADAGAVASSKLENKYSDIYEAYQKYLRENGAVDFEDLILCVVELFSKHPDILAFYHNRYRHLLVDEYQDTNAVQFELVRLLAENHRNLVVVGDEDQSIYSWRGADISNLLDFQKRFPDARIIKLEQNYRSTANILNIADSLIARNSERIGKTLFTAQGAGAPIFIIQARHESEETAVVAESIMRLTRHTPLRCSDIAIFYRVTALSRPYEDAMRRARIPYRIVGGLKFYDRAEIKDLIAFLQTAQNPGNSLALFRVVNKPKRGLGASSVQAIIDFARANSVSEYETMLRAVDDKILPRAAAKSAAGFARQIREWHEFGKSNKTSELLKRILDDTQYAASLGDPALFDVRARLDNIGELQTAIMEHEREHPLAALQDYLENVSLVNATDTLMDEEDSVSLMTLHSAKGLEFPAVFIAGLDADIFPNIRAVEAGGLEEERRLLYVGITRARRLLFLTHSWSRPWYGQWRSFLPSSFLRELPKKLIEEINPLDFEFASLAQFLADIVPAGTPAPAELPGPDDETNGHAHRPPPRLAFDVGQRVSHPLLGEGIIEGVSGSGKSTTYLVRIDDGKLFKLLARLSNLKTAG